MKNWFSRISIEIYGVKMTLTIMTKNLQSIRRYRLPQNRFLWPLQRQLASVGVNKAFLLRYLLENHEVRSGCFQCCVSIWNDELSQNSTNAVRNSVSRKSFESHWMIIFNKDTRVRFFMPLIFEGNLELSHVIKGDPDARTFAVERFEGDATWLFTADWGLL